MRLLGLLWFCFGNDAGLPRVNARSLGLCLVIFTSGLFSIGVEQAVARDGDQLAGLWTYRSFHNNPSLVTGNEQTALSLFFAEATFSFVIGKNNDVSGALDWDGGGLDIRGTVRPTTDGSPLAVELVGTGRAGTQTENWEYDYLGFLAPNWSSGVNQIPALVGTVLRAKPHGGAPAGYVASFIAVKH
ncbi:hypothetical protein [Mesorhizobium sp. M0220]|uniref:hypothetical protein n=1 Tax=unclassified Mesorhizobium TaxID=325217 RepID=UPI00333A1A19